MEKLIDRLRNEASADAANGEIAGAKAGSAFANEDFSRSELQRLATDGLPRGCDSIFDLLEQEYAHLVEDSDWQRTVHKDNAVRDKAAFDQGFTKGFLAAVREIWKEVESRL